MHGKRESEGENERERECVCACVCVYVKERERWIGRKREKHKPYHFIVRQRNISTGKAVHHGKGSK